MKACICLLLSLAIQSHATPLQSKRHVIYRRDCEAEPEETTNTNTNPVPIASPQPSIIPATNSINPVPVPAAAPITGGNAGANPFCNVVFNTGAGTNPGFPDTTWASLTAAGVDKWVGFTMKKLSETPSYNGVKANAQLDANQLPLIMDPSGVSAAMDLIKGPNAPSYLGLFNEPDYSYEGATPVTDGAAAAAALGDFFTLPHPKTTYLSPALAYTGSDWLPTFKASCNGCWDQISIISAHLYSSSTTDILNHLAGLHAAWPDKKIWVTEMSPADAGCSLDEAGMIAWMQDLLPRIKALGYVERIFWNCGERGGGLASGKCNPSLTNTDGSSTPLLQAYGQFCKGI